MTHKKTSPLRTAPVRALRKDDGNAFIPDPGQGAAHTDDSLAEGLAEAFLESATSGEEQGEEAMNALVAEELGGPFLEEDTTFESTAEEVITESRRRRRASTAPAAKHQAAGRKH